MPDYPPKRLIYCLNGLPLIPFLARWKEDGYLPIYCAFLIIKKAPFENDPWLTEVAVRYAHGDDTPAVLVIQTDTL